jgi:hypothetical protein
MMKTLVIFLLILVSISLQVFSATIKVPADYPKIQLAINASVNGDTVLVSPGTYFENIKFGGKKIIVSSLFLTTGNYTYINNTIINGSIPSNPDTGSCVIFVNGEDSTSVIEGFTLTGGTGTKWVDEHGAGTYIEGGAILSALASPTIKYNLIINNEAIRRPSGIASTGGGGLRCGDGAPHILNNIIMNNRGMYGGGITLNYCGGAVVKNNIIVQNKVFQAVVGAPTYGGGGIWINSHKSANTSPNIVENNTIVGNVSYGDPSTSSAGIGGGIWAGTSLLQFNNNIVWNNLQALGHQVEISGSNTTITYNDLEESNSGIGNISLNPAFTDSSFYLSGSSPCIDAGNPSASYNDPPQTLNPSLAELPSMGTVRNDIGAYGGPARSFMPSFSQALILTPASGTDFGYLLPGGNKTVYIPFLNLGAAKGKIDSIRFVQNLSSELSSVTLLPFSISPGKKDSLAIKWSPLQQRILGDTVYIFINSSAEPAKISIAGNSIPTPSLHLDLTQLDMGNINVNTPAKDTSFYVYNWGTAFDSVVVAFNLGNVNPFNAKSVTPTLFKILPADSQKITFSISPPLITRVAFDIYTQPIQIISKFGSGQTIFSKSMRFHLTGVLDVQNENVNKLNFSLDQNYPNPFNPSTKINYYLPFDSKVTLEVFNIAGEGIGQLVNQEQSAGDYSVNFNSSSLNKNISSGVYFYKLTAVNTITGNIFSSIKKMILLK